MSPLLQDDPTRTADHGYFSWERAMPFNRAAIRAELAESLRFALIRQHCVQWRMGGYVQPAADALYDTTSKDAEAAFHNFAAAIANGADDATVAALARTWHELAFDATVESLADAAEAEQDVAFPITKRA